MATSTKKKLITIATDYEKAFFYNFPEQALFWGKTEIDLDRFTDHSLTALKQWHEKEDQSWQSHC